MGTASFDAPVTDRNLGSAVYRDEDFPGCVSFHLPASEIDHYEGRLEFWDGHTETAWRIPECYRRRELARNRPRRKCSNRGVNEGCPLAGGPRRRPDIKEMLKKMPGATQHLHTGRLRAFSERR